MADKKKQAENQRDDVPSTVARSDDKAVRTWKKTHDSAVDSYGDGQRAHRAAFASLKHTHEKVGDHWEPKDASGPSDKQAEKSTPQSREDDDLTAGGVDTNARKGHLNDVAKKVGIDDPDDMKKDELVDAINKANQKETATSRKK